MAVKRRPFRTKILLHLGLLPFLIFALFPFYHMTLTSLKTDGELYDRHAVPLLIRKGPTLEHYRNLIWETGPRTASSSRCSPPAAPSWSAPWPPTRWPG